MVINQTNLKDLYTGFSTAFNKSYDETPVHYTQIAMTVPSETRDTTYGWLGQIPSMREWIGSREIQNLIAYDYTIKNKTFELTTKIPVNDIADDQYGIYTPLVCEMGLSAKAHPDTLIFDLLGHGFTEKSYDKVPFFSNSHPLGKSTQSNMGTRKLNAASYAEARCKMMAVKGEHNRTLNIIPDLLVVAPQNEAAARELLFADLIS